MSTTSPTALSTVSEATRPPKTALRAIGSDRSRLMKPFCRSSASAKPVVPALNSTVCTAMPGIR